MTSWKYFGYFSPTGRGCVRIFRCPDNSIDFLDQSLIERAFPNGVWREDLQAQRLIMNEHLQGWFSPKDDELSEEDAFSLLADWDKNGWPDLPGRY
jgi:hypothetical protein